MNITYLQPFCRYSTIKTILVMVSFILLQSACATTLEKTEGSENRTNRDPLESINRTVQRFNDVVDKVGLKPLAKGYVAVTPSPVKKSVSHFFSNLAEPSVVINQLLQGKVKLGIEDSARFVFNSTFGIAGLIDIATPMGLVKHDEDFGQTLGVWGLGSGVHLNVPLWGPTNLRDGLGSVVDSFTYPLGYLNHIPSRNASYVLLALDGRAGLFSSEALITGDRYLFIRDAFNQNREFLIKDGVVEDSFLDDDFSE